MIGIVRLEVYSLYEMVWNFITSSDGGRFDAEVVVREVFSYVSRGYNLLELVCEISMRKRLFIL